MKNQVYLGLGTNLGNKLENLTKTIDVLSQNVGIITSRSLIYQSEPWGFEAKDLFYNMVIEIETSFSPDRLLIEIQKIEKLIGRKVKTKVGYESRLIDIDILLYGNEVVEKPSLKIPHLFNKERLFVLQPLLEVLNSNSIFKNEYEHQLKTVFKLKKLKKVEHL
ncbi:MAG: 2-amino-4-hydroxy-6-hydroxymethyldihydropteridine diphosphokinase [Flavobacteriales bacterium]|nr:2-amino-4-hydroxy-6-hydroxymethyldihydropteridine diphosphokinase [Flavobacteriales bacterium]